MPSGSQKCLRKCIIANSGWYQHYHFLTYDKDGDSLLARLMTEDETWIWYVKCEEWGRTRRQKYSGVFADLVNKENGGHNCLGQETDLLLVDSVERGIQPTLRFPVNLNNSAESNPK